MSSPSAALIWEIWRKNRWGFAALLILFGIGFGFALHVNYLRAEVRRMENEIRFSEQVVEASQILPSSPTGLVARTVRLQLGRGASGREGTIIAVYKNNKSSDEGTDSSASSPRGFFSDGSSPRDGFHYVPDPNAKVLYEGIFTADDKIAWSLNSEKTNTIKIALGGKVLFDGPFPSNAFSVLGPDLDLSWTFPDETEASELVDQVKQPVAQQAEEPSLEPSWRPTWSTPARLMLNGLNGYYVSLAPPDPNGREEVAAAWSGIDTWRKIGLSWCVTLMLFSVLVVFGIFGCAESSSSYGFTGIPPRRFALPVRTETLVLWPVILGCVTLFALYFAWTRLVIADLLPDRFNVPDLYLSTLLLAGLTVFQALVWGLSSFPKIRVWLVSVWLLGILPLAGYAIGTQRVAIRADWMIQESLLTATFLVIWLAGISASVLGVRKERCGAWTGRKLTVPGITRIGALFPRSLTLRSPLGAQFWMEWNRNFRFPLLIWVLVVMGVYASVLIAVNSGILSFRGATDLVNDRVNARSLPLAADILWLLMIIGGFGGIAVIGSIGARDAGANHLAVSSFSATRPVSVGALLTAKLAAGMVAWLLTSGILCCGILTVAYSLGGDPQRSAALLITLILVISLNLITGILPINLLGRSPGFPWSLLPILLVCLGLMNLVVWFERRPQLFGILSLLLYCLVALKLGTAYWGFRRSIQLRLASVRFVVGCASVWLLGTVVLETLAWAVPERGGSHEWFYGWFSDATLWVPLVVLAVPLARIAVSPLALAMNRHR